MDLLNYESNKREFLEIIKSKSVRTVLQPILSLRSGDVEGYEALTRGPSGSFFENPENLFRISQTCNMVWELEYLCRAKALEKFGAQEVHGRLFLNVNPNVMHDSKFRKGFTKGYIEQFNINPQRIVFEITEREAVRNVTDFVNTVDNYKDQEYMIAIDDVGSGYSGLNLISEVRPHFIKLDMNLIRNIEKDFVKQAIVKSMCEFAKLTNTFLVAEGIETEAEMRKLIDMGVNYGQGYFIQRPGPEIHAINEEVLDVIRDQNRKKNHFYGKNISEFYIKNISRKLNTLNSSIKVSQVDEMIKADPSVPGYCILEDEEVSGIVTRNELYKHLSGLYGYTLYGNKAVKEIMNREILTVDCRETIDVVSRKAMLRGPEEIYDFIVVTQENRYFGIVTVKDLLEKSIEIEVMNAKNLNPLSELPGNIIIENELMQAINSVEEYYVMYFDIDNFKAYNDVYGFENGDRVIVMLAEILKDVFSKNEFTGHIGGDDFIAISEKKDFREKCARVIAEFDGRVKQFYREEDYEKGYILSRNRRGIEECFPLTSLSVACLGSRQYSSIYDLSENASRLKKECKLLEGSNCICEKDCDIGDKQV